MESYNVSKEVSQIEASLIKEQVYDRKFFQNERFCPEKQFQTSLNVRRLLNNLFEHFPLNVEFSFRLFIDLVHPLEYYSHHF